MIMYLLDKQQQIIKAIDKVIIEATMVEEINTANQLTFSVMTNSRIDTAIQYVCIPAPRGDAFLMFKLISETVKNDRVEYTAVESAYDELKAYSYIKDMRPSGKTAGQMLAQVIQGTRWSLGYIADTNQSSTSFYYITVLEAIQKIVELFNVELTFDVNIDKKTNVISSRRINLYTQQGKRTGKRFEYGSNLLEVTREQSSENLITALVGRGKGEEVSQGEDGSPDGYGRRITFTDVEWKKANGNPTDKPRGQEYVEDKNATALYGFSDGRPRIGLTTFEDITDPQELLKATWASLQIAKRPQVAFKARVLDVGDLGLGDTVAIIRHDLGIEYFTRVYKVEHDLLNKANNTIELGDDFSQKSLTNYVADVAKIAENVKNTAEYAVSSASGKNKNYYSRTKPQYANEGDNLFLDLGNGETELYAWHNGNWELVVSTADTTAVKRQVEQAQADLAQVRADANRISETQTESAKRLDEQMQELRAKTSDNATNVQNVIRDVAQAHTDYLNQQADISKQKADLEKTKQSLQTTSQNLDQARQDLISNSSRLNKLEVGVDGVTVNVNNLNTKVDNIKIGGTNLIRNSGNPKTTDGWGIFGANTSNRLIVHRHNFWKNAQETLFMLGNSNSSEVGMSSNRVKVERNTEYTLSYWAFEDSNVISSDTFFLGRKNGETSDFTKIIGLVKSRVYSDAKAEYITITFNTGDCDEGYIRFDNNGTRNVGHEGGLYLANIKLEKGNRATDYSPAPEELIEKVAQFKVDLDGIHGTVANAQGDIAQIKLTENGMQQNIKDAQGNISTLQNDAKGFKQQFSDINGNVANLSASAKNFELQMQDAQGNISSLQNDAKQFKQQFADTNGNIATIKRNATELSEQLASKVGNTEYQSFKTQTAKELSEKLVKTDLNGYATTAEVKLTADGLKEQYNSVRSKVNNLKIGGVNLIDNGGNPKDTDGWTVNGTSGDKFLRVGTHPFWKNSQEKLFILYNSDKLYEATMSSKRIKVERNTDYTLSYWAFNDGHVVDTDTFFLGRQNDETSDFTKIFNLISKRKYSVAKAEYVTVTFNTGEADEGYIRFDNNRTYDTQCALYLANIQLEKGNVATDYGPSANDVANAISGVSKDLTNYKAVVERDYAKNSSVYTKNEVVNLTNNSKDSAVNAIKNDTNWKGLVNINTNSAFLQTADGFESEVVKKATPLVEGGGVNLVPSSGKPADTARAGWYGVAVYPHAFWKNGKENVFVINNGDTKYEKSASSDWITVERGGTYTVSFYACMSGNCSNYDVFFLGRKKGETESFTQIRQIVATQRVSGAMFEYRKFTFNVGQSDEGYLRFDNNSSTDGNNSVFLFTYVKMEKGTVATPWTPAPEDLATVVSVNKVIDTADSHTQIIKDYLTGDNSQFKLLKNAVNLKVEKGDVIGQINLEAGKTLLQNKKIYLDADTVAFSGKAFIPSAAITDLSADKITTGTLNAANVDIINLNVNKLSGDKASFIKSSWNSISNYIDIDPYRLRVGNSSNGYIDLTSNGMHVYSSFNNEEMGWIHANSYRGHPEQNGLEFDLNAPNGDYMAWAMQEKEHEDYILQMEFRRSNWGNKQQGLNIYSDVKFHSKIWPSDDATGYGAMRLIRANFGGQWGNEFAMDGYQSGIWFGDNGGLAIIIRGKYLMLSDVKFPTAINSDGTVQTWNSF
ncbi:phage tail spike protein [Ligilactobacillus agilis]|uniref:phage tail spike protein n=1 Tax=Ligilactobacillus agilis TaxID=1601 RepID=UPI003F88701E